jgi:gliding motility-associated lipoprotein GldH
MGKHIRDVFFLCFLIGLAACQTMPLSEQSTIHPDHQWTSAKPEKYLFNITDTNSSYKVIFVIRHHNAYHYKNIWIELSRHGVGEKLQTESFNLNLADDQKGWLGTGMDDIYDQRIPLTIQPIKLKYGINTFTIRHTMREDPLQNILSTGIRIEKASL